MPQSATPVPHRKPVPAISHFNLFGFRPEIIKKLLKSVKLFITDVWFLTKKVVSSAYAGYKKSCSNILSLSMF